MRNLSDGALTHLQILVMDELEATYRDPSKYVNTQLGLTGYLRYMKEICDVLDIDFNFICRSQYNRFKDNVAGILASERK